MSTTKKYIRHLKGLSVPDRVQLGLSTVIKLSLLNAFVVGIISGEWSVAFISIAALIATLLPWFLAKSYELPFPIGFEFVTALFTYATLFLGEAHGFYTKFWWWDLLLHGGSAIAFGFIGFLILYSLYRASRFQAPPSLIVFFAFSASIAIGALWEIFEFAMDSFFGLNMQKSGLKDTMWDLIIAAVGACAASIPGYLYLRYRIQGLGIFRFFLKSYMNAKKLPE
ncbi:MAG: hypothetical protein AAB726_03730 [Patescibacteria group bacterium]